MHRTEEHKGVLTIRVLKWCSLSTEACCCGNPTLTLGKAKARDEEWPFTRGVIFTVLPQPEGPCTATFLCYLLIGRGRLEESWALKGCYHDCCFQTDLWMFPENLFKPNDQDWLGFKSVLAAQVFPTPDKHHVKRVVGQEPTPASSEEDEGSVGVWLPCTVLSTSCFNFPFNLHLHLFKFGSVFISLGFLNLFFSCTSFQFLSLSLFLNLLVKVICINLIWVVPQRYFFFNYKDHKKICLQNTMFKESLSSVSLK